MGRADRINEAPPLVPPSGDTVAAGSQGRRSTWIGSGEFGHWSAATGARVGKGIDHSIHPMVSGDGEPIVLVGHVFTAVNSSVVNVPAFTRGRRCGGGANSLHAGMAVESGRAGALGGLAATSALGGVGG